MDHDLGKLRRRGLFSSKNNLIIVKYPAPLYNYKKKELGEKMNKNEFTNKYWSYYLLLESDFMKTNRYMQISDKNYNAFSIEYAKQIQSVCGELDTVFKLASMIDFNTNGSIKKYKPAILERYNEITSNEVIVPAYELSIKPFDDWNNSNINSPQWWKDYNKIKHQRSNSLEAANLKNMISSLAGLFLLEMYILVEICKKEYEGTMSSFTFYGPRFPSKLFIIKDWEFTQLLGDPIF